MNPPPQPEEKKSFNPIPLALVLALLLIGVPIWLVFQRPIPQAVPVAVMADPTATPADAWFSPTATGSFALPTATYAPVQSPPTSGGRTGARCNDGSYSSATGRGACSRHGGVAQWLYG